MSVGTRRDSPRRRVIAAAMPVFMLATLVAGIVAAGAAHAAARPTSVSGTDPTGDATAPRGDLTAYSMNYLPSVLTLSVTTAQGVDPRTSPNWAGGASGIEWALDESDDGNPEFFVDYLVGPGGLTAEVSRNDNNGTVVCSATPTYDGTTGYGVSFDPACIGSPSAVRMAVLMAYDSDPTNPAPTTLSTDRAPDAGFSAHAFGAPAGYWLLGRDGGIFAFGDAAFHGSTGSIRLNQPVVGMAGTPTGDGYFFVAGDGGIFAFGDAVFRGSTGSIRLNQPIGGMAVTPSGNGYWLVARDGGIFAFGDAVFRGSTGSIPLNQPIVGMAASPSGNGYWLVARDGGIFAFGDAVFRGSTGSITLNQPIVGMAATASGLGYWLVAQDGGIFAFGDAVFHGSAGGRRLSAPIVGMAVSPTGNGYWLVGADGAIYAFGDALFKGSAAGTPLNAPIVGMAPAVSRPGVGVDTTPPAVSLEIPANNGAVNSARPTLSGAAGTEFGDRPAVTVKIYAGSSATGSVIRTVSADGSSGHWSGAPSTALAEGVYTATASQSDGAGNSATSAPHTFTVDLQAPTVTMTSPANNSSTANQKPPFSGAASSASGDQPSVTVRIFSGTSATGSPVQTLTAPVASNSWTVTPSTNLAQGTYTAQAAQSDAAGNVAAVTTTFTIDTSLPNVTLTAPATNTSTNDQTPTFSGASGIASADEKKVTLNLYAGNTVSGTPTQPCGPPADAPSGSWSCDAGSNLPEGTYTAQATQKNAVTNAVGTSSANVFTVDITSPTPTLTAPVNGSSTSNQKPSFAGVAGTATGDLLTALTVKVCAGASAGCASPVKTLTAIPAAGGAYSVAPDTVLPEGQYTAQTTQLDQAGNTGTSAASTFTVDTTAPTGLTMTAPTANQLTNDDTPTFSGAAGTAAGDQTAVTVKIYAGATATGTPVQTPTGTASSGAWTLNAAHLPDGAYTATASQSDAAGNTATTTPVSFYVDATGPTVDLQNPVEGATINTTTPTFNGTGGTQTGANPDLLTPPGGGVTVNIYVGPTAGGIPIQTTSPTVVDAVTGRWTVTAAALPGPGLYTAKATQPDGAGNIGMSAPHTFTIDTTVPSVTLTAPAQGATTTDVTPTFSGTSGASPPNRHVMVSVWAGSDTTGLPLETLDATPSGTSWTIDQPAPLAAGLYTAQAAQSDVTGTKTGNSEAHTFTINDGTAPVVSITAPAEDSFTNSPRPSVSGTAGIVSGDNPSVTVKIYAGRLTGTPVAGSPVRTITVTRSSSDGSFTATPSTDLPDGPYTAQATQTDTGGNPGISNAEHFTVDRAAPVVTITTPAEGASTTAKRPPVTGTSGFASGDSTTVTVNIYTGTTAAGTPVQTLTTTRNGTGAFTATPTADLTDGTYTAQATQSDAAGNTGTSAARHFTVDSTAPVVTITQPADGSFTNTSTVTFQGTAGTAPGDNKTTITVTLTGPSGATLIANGITGTWSVTSGALTAGNYTVTASETDAATNTGTSSPVAFTVDRTGPAVTVNDVGNPTTHRSSGSPTFTGTASTGSGDLPANITVTVSGPTPKTLTADGSSGTWSAPATGLAEGSYTVTATESDQAGNSTISASKPFTVDTTAPTVTLDDPTTDPANGAQTPIRSARPNFKGTGTHNSGDNMTVTVKIYSGSTATGTPVQSFPLDVNQSTGAWSGPTPNDLATGTYTATATQSDDVGNSSTTASRTFDIAVPPATVKGLVKSDCDGSTIQCRTAERGNLAGATVEIAYSADGFTGCQNPSAPTCTFTATNGVYNLSVDPGKEFWIHVTAPLHQDKPSQNLKGPMPPRASGTGPLPQVDFTLIQI